jgi:U3 small nucleolar RNA-associated protein 7
MRFCPFQDTIAIGHARGVSSIVVPGSGEANIDSFEDGVFENKKGRQEREVRNLLDKVRVKSNLGSPLVLMYCLSLSFNPI